MAAVDAPGALERAAPQQSVGAHGRAAPGERPPRPRERADAVRHAGDPCTGVAEEGVVVVVRDVAGRHVHPQRSRPRDRAVELPGDVAAAVYLPANLSSLPRTYKS